MAKPREEIAGLNELEMGLYETFGVFPNRATARLCHFCKNYWWTKYGGFDMPVEYDDGCSVDAPPFKRYEGEVNHCRRFAAKPDWQQKIDQWADGMVAEVLRDAERRTARSR